MRVKKLIAYAAACGFGVEEYHWVGDRCYGLLPVGFTDLSSDPPTPEVREMISGFIKQGLEAEYG